MISSTNIVNILWWAFSGAFVIAFYFISDRIDSDRTAGAPVILMKKVAEELDMPQGSKRDGDSYLMNRGGNIVITQMFDYVATKPDIIYFYKNMLSRSGWMYVEADRFNGHENGLEFCRDGINLKLDTQVDSFKRLYSIHVGWSKEKNGRYYCDK